MTEEGGEGNAGREGKEGNEGRGKKGREGYPFPEQTSLATALNSNSTSVLLSYYSQGYTQSFTQQNILDFIKMPTYAYMTNCNS